MKARGVEGRRAARARNGFDHTNCQAWVLIKMATKLNNPVHQYLLKLLEAFVMFAKLDGIEIKTGRMENRSKDCTVKIFNDNLEEFQRFIRCVYHINNEDEMYNVFEKPVSQ